MASTVTVPGWVPMTVLDVLQSTTAYFKKRGVESPRLNAEHLLAHSLGLGRMQLYLEFERELNEAELAPLRGLVKRRGEGVPLQHLLGTVEFLGRTFRVDRRALIPRPETEQLVERLIQELSGSRPKLVDVGTGSGVIAISLAAVLFEAEIHAVDISPEALELARENASATPGGERVRFHRSDLLESVEAEFDLIVANLPYIATAERGTLSREVLHDPEVALFGGSTGDELIRQLIRTAPARLRAGGMLALEIGVGQSEGLVAHLAQKNYHDIKAEKDYQGVTRFLFAQYG